MTTVVDAARDADATKNCATNTYGGAMNIGFVINATLIGDVETHIPHDGAGVNNTGNTGWVPVIDMSGFWLGSTPATVR